MKKKVCITLGLALVFMISMFHIQANETEDKTPNFPTNNLYEWSENDKVIQLPDGGYLKGEAILHKEDGSVVVYNSETDPNAKTVAEIREELNK